MTALAFKTQQRRFVSAPPTLSPEPECGFISPAQAVGRGVGVCMYVCVCGGGEGGGRQTETIRRDGGFLKKFVNGGSDERGRGAGGERGCVMKQAGRSFALPCGLTQPVTLSSVSTHTHSHRSWDASSLAVLDEK